MPRVRVSMRKIKEVLRLSLSKALSQREIAACVQIGKTTVQEIIAKAQEYEMTWDKIKTMREAHLAELLFPPCAPLNKTPDLLWSSVKNELAKKGVTLSLLWVEYREENPNGLSYSQFCRRYRTWIKDSKLSMRQQHKYGEKLFVDFSGLTLDYLDPASNEVKKAQIFVAVLGASNYTFAYAVADQSIANWVHCHRKTFEFLHGVPAIIVPDNLKSGVNKPCRYDPDINPTFLRMAEHYGSAVMPTRTYKPKDKAKVEVGVQIVQRWILARLRKQTFTSLQEINSAISMLLVALNEKNMRILGVSRKALFEQYERQALKPLPVEPFEIATWKRAKVNIDYHVEVTRHFYSVPFRLVGKHVEVCFTRNKVEVFHEGERVACHIRSSVLGRHSTLTEHMPRQHAAMAKWTPDRIFDWAKQTGTFTSQLCAKIMASRAHPEQGYRSCLGVMRLSKKYSSQRVELACTRAIKMNVPTYTSVKSILQNKLDQAPLAEKQQEKNAQKYLQHQNIRGAGYYS